MNEVNIKENRYKQLIYAEEILKSIVTEEIAKVQQKAISTYEIIHGDMSALNIKHKTDYLKQVTILIKKNNVLKNFEEDIRFAQMGGKIYLESKQIGFRLL